MKGDIKHTRTHVCFVYTFGVHIDISISYRASIYFNDNIFMNHRVTSLIRKKVPSNNNKRDERMMKKEKNSKELQLEIRKNPLI